MTFSKNFKELYLAMSDNTLIVRIIIMIFNIIMILVKHCQCTTFCHIRNCHINFQTYKACVIPNFQFLYYSKYLCMHKLLYDGDDI